MRIILFLSIWLTLSGCASYNYSAQIQIGDPIISFEGATLDEQPVVIPRDLLGQPALLLFGYVHKSQFDIDRWLIGLDMTKTNVSIYEIPAIQGFIPGLFSKAFDDAMREGIPKELWRDVITVYQDGDRVQQYTGNQSPKNARVVLLDEKGNVAHFYDRGFSVSALNELNSQVLLLNKPES